ncbi:MAG: beta strand repeat-containing protein, partial [Opitutia bacterium]
TGLGPSTHAATNPLLNAGTPTDTGAAATGAPTGGGIYQTTQTPSVSTDRLFSLAGNATIQSSGTYGNEVVGNGTGDNHASLIWSNTGDIAFVTSGAKTLTLGGTSIGDNIFRLRIVNNPLDSTATALTKADGGLWILNPAVANTYTGTTTISGGALRALDGTGLPTGSLLTINGGVIETSGTFTRTLGAAAGNVQLTGGNSGFAAGSTDRLVVTLGGGALTWGGATFNPSSLVLGSSTALGETEITNSINLGTAARTITVNNNGNTGTMITAGILSGVISGGSTAGTLTKGGGGVLMLGNANTYTGTTTVTAGNLIVTSLGGSGGASSLGSGTGATGALIYNPGDADLNALSYVGSGETATRNLTLQASANFTANRVYRIDSSGSGPLVWNGGTFAHTTRGDTVARILTLELRGSNTDGNQLNMVLTDSTNANFPNVLNVQKTDGGTWILNPASINTFAGTVTAASGLLGLTANSLGTNSTLAFSNGTVFAYGGPLTIARPVTLNNNTTAAFAGSNSITITSTVTKGAGTSDVNFDNFLDSGATLTVSGNYTSAETATSAAQQVLRFRGTGNTVWSGVIGENAAAGGKTRIEFQLAPGGSATLSGSLNTYTDDTLLTQGRLILSKQLGATKRLQLNGGLIEATVAQTFAGTDAAGGVIFNGNPVTFGGSLGFTFNGTTVNWGNNRWIFNELTGGAVINFGAFNTSNDTNNRIFVTGGAGTTNFTGAVTPGTASGGQIYHRGTGLLNFTAANTITTLLMERGSATISGAGSFNALSSTVGNGLMIRSPGVVTIDNAVNGSLATRLGDTSAFSMEGGTFSYVAAAGGTNESTGPARFYGNSKITQTGGASTLTFSSLDFAVFTDPRSSLDVRDTAALGSTRKVVFTGLPSGFHPRFLVGDGVFGAYDATNGIVPFTAFSSAANVGASVFSDVLRVNAAFGADDIAFDRTLRGLAITDTLAREVGATAAANLTVSSGGILASGGVTHVLSVPRLNFVVVTPPTMSTLATGNVVTVGDTSRLAVGQVVSGTNIPGNSYITEIINATSFRINNDTTTAGSGNVLTAAATGYFNVASGTTLDLRG